MRFLMIIALYLFTTTMASGQGPRTNQFMVIGSGTGDNSTIVALVDKEILSNPSIIFNEKQLISNNTAAYLFINTVPIDKLYTELNHLTKSNEIGFNKDALQLLVIGTRDELERYQSLNLDYFSTQYFVSSDGSVADQSFITVRKLDWDCGAYLNQIKGKYLWELDKQKLKSKDELINHEEGRFTVGYRPMVNFGLRSNNLGNYFSNGLSLDYTLGKKIQLYAEGSFALKRPKIQEEIESQIRGQIDVSDIMNGTLTEQDVMLSIPVEIHVYTSFNIGVRYLLTPEKDWSFYASTGLSSISSNKTSGQLDTTLTLTFDGSNPNNNFSPDNLDDEALGLVGTEAVTINSSIGAGFQYKLGGHWRFDLSFNYSTSLRSVRVSDTYNNNTLNIAFGFNYRFKDKKEYEKIHFY